MKQHPEPANLPHRKARADARMFETQRDLAPAFPPPRLVQRLLAGAADSSALQDWGLLMDAVKSRLQQLVEPPQGAPATPLDSAMAQLTRSGVVDCVHALDYLQTMMLRELGRYRQAEQDALDAQAGWLHASDALAGAAAPEHLARQDKLTALPNGRYFRDRLAQALVQAAPQGTPLALMRLDLDGFNAINNVHGRHVGDALLQIVAARLKRAVRVHDMVGRLGDDAFGCLLHGSISAHQLARLAGKLTDAVAAPIQIGALSLTVDANVGLARYPDDGNNADALLQWVDHVRGRPSCEPGLQANRQAPAAAGADAQLHNADLGWPAAGYAGPSIAADAMR